MKMIRFDLPWYDVNYRDSSDYDTPAGKKIAELNKFLRENWITWGIACLDEKWQVVRRYTNRVVLEIDDSVSPEKLEEIKKIVLDLLKVMWATESQLADVFNDGIGKENNDMQSSNIVKRKLEEYDVGSLIWEIKILNPEVKIEADYDRWIIYSSVGIDELVIPEWFYYNEKNGITNKHKTKTWWYVSVHVKPIEKYNPDYI